MQLYYEFGTDIFYAVADGMMPWKFCMVATGVLFVVAFAGLLTGIRSLVA